jgi:hypothetical protein
VTPSLLEETVNALGDPAKNKLFIMTNPGNPSQFTMSLIMHVM